MSVVNIYGNPIIENWHYDEEGKLTTILRENEAHTITKGKVILEEIPDYKQRVFITNHVEIDIKQKIVQDFQFKVDYPHGIIYFHTSREGQEINIDRYYGRGQFYTPAQRIYTKLNDFGEVIETLADIIHSIDELSGQIGDVYEVVSNAVEIINQLNKAIKDGIATKDDLLISIDLANEKLVELNTTINNAGEADRILNATILEALAIKDDLYAIIEGSDLEVVITELNLLKKDSHTHTNKDILDNLTEENETLKYKGQDIGKGDMTTDVYDKDNDGKVDLANNSEKLGGQYPSYYANKDELDNKISISEKGIVGGIAELDSDGKVPLKQLPDIGIGDMTKNVYDINNDGKVDIAEDSEKLGGQLPSYYATKEYVDSKTSGENVDVNVGNIINQINKDGFYQTWQENKVDNVGAGRPLNIYIYIPKDTKSIRNANLRFIKENYRAYDVDEIIEGSLPEDIKIMVNDVDYTYYLSGNNTGFNVNKDNLNITNLLEIDKWNKVSLSSATLGRIDASVFMQLFVGLPRKSIIISEDDLGIYYLHSTSSQNNSTSITAKRTDVKKGINGLYRFTINNQGIGEVYNSTWIDKQILWRLEFNIGLASAVSIVMDGIWIYSNEKMKYEFETVKYPVLFWIKDGNLYTQQWNDISTRTILANNVIKMTTIRGWKNVNMWNHDQGIVVAYIKSDNKAYYRNYAKQPPDFPAVWDNEVVIDAVEGDIQNIKLFRTNDYRTGILLESNGKIYWTISERDWAGMAVPTEYLSAAPEIELEFIKIEYPVGYHAEYISVAPEIEVALLFANTDNEFVEAINKPDEHDDWGWIIDIRVKNPIPLLTLNEILVTDMDKNTPIAMSSIEKIDDFNFRLNVSNIVESGINNISGNIKVKISGVLNPAEKVYIDFEKTFKPINLVPTFIPLPEVEAIYNV